MTTQQAKEIGSGFEIKKSLRENGYADLGWENSPSAELLRAMKVGGWSSLWDEEASWHIRVNEDLKSFYCLDSGD